MKILSIRFRKTKKVYPFVIKDEEKYQIGDTVIVETIRGAQIGTIIHKKDLTEENFDSNDIKIREIKRKLTKEEIASLSELDKKAEQAYFRCKKIVKRVLPNMNLVVGEYTFNEEKLIFYFTANDRLDFRELVKEVNNEFNRRVEFYQIKSNDEGKILNVFGKYGKEIYW